MVRCCRRKRALRTCHARMTSASYAAAKTRHAVFTRRRLLVVKTITRWLMPFTLFTPPPMPLIILMIPRYAYARAMPAHYAITRYATLQLICHDADTCYDYGASYALTWAITFRATPSVFTPFHFAFLTTSTLRHAPPSFVADHALPCQ